MTPWARRSIAGLFLVSMFVLGMAMIPQAAAQPSTDQGSITSMAPGSSPVTTARDSAFRTRGDLAQRPIEAASAIQTGVQETKGPTFSRQPAEANMLVNDHAGEGQVRDSESHPASDVNPGVAVGAPMAASSPKLGDGCVIAYSGGESGGDGSGDSLAVPGGAGRIVCPEELKKTQTADPSRIDLNVSHGEIVKVSWVVRIQVLSDDGQPIPNAIVRIVDGKGNTVAILRTDMNGMTPPFSLVEKFITKDGTVVVNVYTVLVETESGIGQFGLTVDSNRLFTFVLPLPSEGSSLLMTIGVAFAFIGASLASSLSMERSRIAILSPLIPLYTRVKREDIVGQHTRGMILAYLDTNPGEHFGAIKRALSLTNGNAMYHLRFLEKEGLVKTRFDGMLKRYYPRWMNVPPEDDRPIMAMQHA